MEKGLASIVDNKCDEKSSNSQKSKTRFSVSESTTDLSVNTESNLVAPSKNDYREKLRNFSSKVGVKNNSDIDVVKKQVSTRPRGMGRKSIHRGIPYVYQPPISAAQKTSGFHNNIDIPKHEPDYEIPVTRHSSRRGKGQVYTGLRYVTTSNDVNPTQQKLFVNKLRNCDRVNMLRELPREEFWDIVDEEGVGLAKLNELPIFEETFKVCAVDSVPHNGTGSFRIPKDPTSFSDAMYKHNVWEVVDREPIEKTNRNIVKSK